MSDKQIETMLRRIRKQYPDITIIFPEEKTKLTPQNFKYSIQGKTAAIKAEVNAGVRQWNGKTLYSNVKQVKEIIYKEYHMEHLPETEDNLDAMIEEVLEAQKKYINKHIR